MGLTRGTIRGIKVYRFLAKIFSEGLGAVNRRNVIKFFAICFSCRLLPKSGITGNFRAKIRYTPKQEQITRQEPSYWPASHRA